MYALDFEYDGRLLSNYGFIICEFDGQNGLSIMETGYKITFNKVARNRGRVNSLVSTQYDECITAQFHICKNPDEFDDLEITNDEYRDMVRWLNRHEFLQFRVLSEAEGVDRASCYFNATFNIEKIYIHDVLYGLSLTIETDAPFGYGLPFEKTWEVDANETIEFVDLSDDFGFIYPDMTIICGESGDLVISNITFDNTMQINNCIAGEKISVYGSPQILESSNKRHKIYNDFNYEFLRIGNSYTDRVNSLKFSIPCTFTMNYTPTIKDIP